MASGDKCVPICYYEAASNWWVCKHIKKHRSTILSVAWHPNSQIIATACCDFKCRVLSATLEKECADVYVGGVGGGRRSDWCGNLRSLLVRRTRG